MDETGEDKGAQGVRMPPSEEVREEIERAIDNARRTPWDKWFRKQFYRAAAQRRRERPDPGASSERSDEDGPMADRLFRATRHERLARKVQHDRKAMPVVNRRQRSTGLSIPPAFCPGVIT